MKAMKGKLLKKLKTVKQIGYLRPERILQVNASDGYVVKSPPKNDFTLQRKSVLNHEEPLKVVLGNVGNQEPEVIDVGELMKDLEDKEKEIDEEINDKENIRPEFKENTSVIFQENHQFLSSTNSKNEALESNEFKGACRKAVPLAEINASKFRRPDLDSGTLFDPDLLQAFEQAVISVKAQESAVLAEIQSNDIDQEPVFKARKKEEIPNPLLNFEERCPPGGIESVVLYTTSLRGIRKTFEDCRSVRYLLERFKILFLERDISMHSEFKEELWELLAEKVLPPRLFIKGRYIGGAEEVLTLHEQGKFKPLLEEIPVDFNHGPCEGCGGVRFIVCFKCNGSRKIAAADDANDANDDDDDDRGISICRQCNENGLLLCPLCCC